MNIFGIAPDLAANWLVLIAICAALAGFGVGVYVMTISTPMVYERLKGLSDRGRLRQKDELVLWSTTYRTLDVIYSSMDIRMDMVPIAVVGLLGALVFWISSMFDWSFAFSGSALIVACGAAFLGTKLFDQFYRGVLRERLLSTFAQSEAAAGTASLATE